MSSDEQQLREELQQLRENYKTLEHNFDIMSEGYQESLLLYDKLEETYHELEETNKEVRTFWLIRTIKRCLSARYDANVRGDADAVRKIQIIMEAAYRKMINERDFRLNKRLFYGAMIRFPQLYRQFRIRTNRGMVEWERHMKKVRAQEALGKQKNPE